MALITVPWRGGRPLRGALLVALDRPRGAVSRALRHGFIGVELAIMLDGADLRVTAPDRARRADGGRTLDRSVFAPLAARVKPTTHGRVYPRSTESFLVLLRLAGHGAHPKHIAHAAPTASAVSVPPDRGAAAYAVLDRLLHTHASMLTRVAGGRVSPGAVTVILSGAGWPRELIARAYERYAFLEGGADETMPPSLVPLVSDAFATRVGWDPREPWRQLPAEARHIVRSLALGAHADGRRLRFVDVPDRPAAIRRALWLELRVAGVDLIGSHRAGALGRFLRRRLPSTAGNRVGDIQRSHDEHRVNSG